MNDAFTYCEQLVRTADLDRFLAALFASAAHRPALYALYAFDIEVARVPSAVRQAMAGEVRLQWWREILEGRRKDEALANPVAMALIETLDRYPIARARMIDVIEARAFDLYNDPFATTAELEAYVERTRAVIIQGAAALLHGADMDLRAITRHAATASVVCDILRRFPFHISRGHLQIPLDVLERHRARPADIFAGRSSKALLAALAEMRALAREQVELVQEEMSAVPVKVVPAILPVALVPLYLRQLERARYDPFHTIIAVPQWRRQWALWRAAHTWAR